MISFLNDILWSHDLYSDNAWFSDDFMNSFSYFQYCCDICFLISVHDFVWVCLILHLQFFIMTLFCFQSILELCHHSQFISSIILCFSIFISLNIIYSWWLAIFMFVSSVFFVIFAISFCLASLTISNCFHFFSFILRFFHNCEFM